VGSLAVYGEEDVTLTGTHASMYGGYDYLNERRPFLSTTLKNDGFLTVGYHSNPHLGPNRNYNHGFDVFNDGDEDRDDANTVINFVDEHIDSDSYLYSILRKAWHIFGSATGVSAYKDAESISNDALTWLSDGHKDSFFMWVHYMDVHYPFQPPNKHLKSIGHETLSARRVANLNDSMQESPESLTKEDIADLKALYRGELHYVDYQIGRLLDELSKQGIRDETMVVFTADHGEAFGEHNRWGHHPHMYDELLRVPLIVDEPGREPESMSTQVSLIDIFPTICDACNVERPEKLQGDTLFNKDNGVELGTSQGGQRLAARTSEWKCLWHVADDEVELYNLDSDPEETHEVSDNYPDVVNRLKGEMKDYRDTAHSTDTEIPEVEESDAVKQRLRDLGYKK
jgi:arylsulfatase A-like enzyme